MQYIDLNTYIIGDMSVSEKTSEVAGCLRRWGIDEEFVKKFEGNINTFTDVFFHGINPPL